jgi:hypothetical protein
MEFIKGVGEPVVPEVKLTRSKDGSTGTGAGPPRLAAIEADQRQMRRLPCSCSCVGQTLLQAQQRAGAANTSEIQPGVHVHS